MTKEYMTPFEQHQANKLKSQILENAKTDKPQRAQIPDSEIVLARSKENPRANQPSPILIWHMHESEKRKEGKYNEIDGNEMKAALKGVINHWKKVVDENKVLIETFFLKLEGKEKNYTEAKEMWLKIKSLYEASKK